MTTFALADDLCAAFPQVHIAVVTATGVRGDRPWLRVADALAELERRCADGSWTAPGEDDPHIAAWHDAYRRFGTNPRRQRPSVEALCRRLGRTGALPRISGAVDCYNLVSVRHVVPAGAFDAAALSAAVTVRFAIGTEEFVPLGEPDVVERPGAGEVIYADAAGVLTRHWNHRDADRTKVTPESAEIVFLLETVATAFVPAVERAAADLVDEVGRHAGEVRVEVLSAAAPVARIGVSSPGR